MIAYQVNMYITADSRLPIPAPERMYFNRESDLLLRKSLYSIPSGGESWAWVSTTNVLRQIAFPNEVVMALITCSSNVSILYVSRRSTYRRTSMVFSRRNLLMISTACSLMYPPSMRPGVSIMFKVNPALVREHIIGLRPSDWKALTLATLSPTMELTVDDLPTPPFPITRIVNVLTFSSLSLPRSSCRLVWVAAGNCCSPVHSRGIGAAITAGRYGGRGGGRLNPRSGGGGRRRGRGLRRGGL